MTKASVNLQDLRRRIYVKAKAETTWRFWGMYVHVCKMETLREAYALAQNNDGAPGSDGVTFAAIEAQNRDRLDIVKAVDRVARAIVQHKTRVIDIDLRSYFDNIRHDRLLAKVARRLESKATANSQ